MSLPRWKCHKNVGAAEIEAIDRGQDGSACLILAIGEGRTFRYVVGSEFMEKHKPRVGGYFVIYEDGYESFSPPEPFESGYTKIEEEAPAKEDRQTS